MKLLFCYQAIISKELVDFTLVDINNLVSFLRGFNMGGQTIQFRNLTLRSNDTVNGYLSVYRTYLEFLGLRNRFLSASKKTLMRTDFGKDQKYKTNLKSA